MRYFYIIICPIFDLEIPDTLYSRFDKKEKAYVAWLNVKT